MSQYEAVTEAALAELRKQGIRVAASGDIFQDQHRIAIFQKAGLKEYFPLWPGTTQDQIRAFLQSGLKAYVSCVDSGRLDACFVGRTLDAGFFEQLPPHIDPCGERGEFHTFVYDGPLFNEPIKVSLGEIVLRESFYFCDLVPS